MNSYCYQLVAACVDRHELIGGSGWSKMAQPGQFSWALRVSHPGAKGSVKNQGLDLLFSNSTSSYLLVKASPWLSSRCTEQGGVPCLFRGNCRGTWEGQAQPPSDSLSVLALWTCTLVLVKLQRLPWVTPDQGLHSRSGWQEWPSSRYQAQPNKAPSRFWSQSGAEVTGDA